MEHAKLEKIAEALKDEEFAKRVMEMETKEEIIEAFADEKNITLSAEEIDELIQKGQNAISSSEFDRINKNLSEDELISVSGGWNSNANVVKNAKAFGKGFINPSSDIPSSVKGIFETDDNSALFERAGNVAGAGIKLIVSIAANCMKSS